MRLAAAARLPCDCQRKGRKDFRGDEIAQATAHISAPIVLDKHPGMREGRPQLVHMLE
jgi:hypothetical protein